MGKRRKTNLSEEVQRVTALDWLLRLCAWLEAAFSGQGANVEKTHCSSPQFLSEKPTLAIVIYFCSSLISTKEVLYGNNPEAGMV